MKTKCDIPYSSAPYGMIATIPKGTPVERASNLPYGESAFWAKAWKGMTREQYSWYNNYGFLVDAEQCEEG